MLLHTTSRRPRNVALATLAAVAVFGGSTAQATEKVQHRYDSAIQNAPLSTAKGYPGAGGTAVLAGTWKTVEFGDGALVDHVTITKVSGSTISFRGTEVGFLAGGSVKSKFTGQSVVQSDGSQKLSIKGRIVGGTAAFSGATGKYKFKGKTQSGLSVITGRSTGTVSF
jgi:hypothetical protein